MMFGGEDYHLKAGIFQSTYPLSGIQFGRIEKGGVFLAISPFIAGESVDTEVQESSQFQSLPIQLLRSGNQTGCHIHFLLQSGIGGKTEMLYKVILFRMI